MEYSLLKNTENFNILREASDSFELFDLNDKNEQDSNTSFEIIENPKDSHEIEMEYTRRLTWCQYIFKGKTYCISVLSVLVIESIFGIVSSNIWDVFYISGGSEKDLSFILAAYLLGEMLIYLIYSQFAEYFDIKFAVLTSFMFLCLASIIWLFGVIHADKMNYYEALFCLGIGRGALGFLRCYKNGSYLDVILGCQFLSYTASPMIGHTIVSYCKKYYSISHLLPAIIAFIVCVFCFLSVLLGFDSNQFEDKTNTVLQIQGNNSITTVADLDTDIESGARQVSTVNIIDQKEEKSLRTFFLFIIFSIESTLLIFQFLQLQINSQPFEIKIININM